VDMTWKYWNIWILSKLKHVFSNFVFFWAIFIPSLWQKFVLKLLMYWRDLHAVRVRNWNRWDVAVWWEINAVLWQNSYVYRVWKGYLVYSGLQAVSKWALWWKSPPFWKETESLLFSHIIHNFCLHHNFI
jgi:hypothetical protein